MACLNKKLDNTEPDDIELFIRFFYPKCQRKPIPLGGGGSILPYQFRAQQTGIVRQIIYIMEAQNMSNVNISPEEAVIIDGKELHRIEYNGQRVITTKEIAEHHDLPVKVINQKYRRSKKHFTQGTDYFEVPMDEVLRSQLVTTNSMDRSDYLLLITESGYLKFVKTINDDKAWRIYSTLIDCYFATKRLNAIEKDFLARNKEHRTGITSQWARHDAKDYRGLTIAEYIALFGDDTIRKAQMTGDQVTMLSIFEAVESIKLRNNPQISGDAQLKQSLSLTGTTLAATVAPKQIPK